jgi:glycosyltransferase involved in cell wall biosynthesis
MFVTIIIPTFNPLSQLQDLLMALLVQDAPSAEREIILVDNNTCPDQGSFSKLTSFLGVTNNLRYFHEPTPGLHAGRHRGLHESRGDILTFIDDDIVPVPGWLDAIGNTFIDPNVHLVGGPSLPLYEHAPHEWMEAFWTRSPDGKSNCGYLSLLDYGDKEYDIEPTLVWGLNYSIRKKTLTDLGGFHPDGMPWESRRYRGDGESYVSMEIKKRELLAVYTPHARVYHRVPKERLTLDYFQKRGYLQGISDSFTHIRHAGGIVPRVIEDKKEYTFLSLMNHGARKILLPFRQDNFSKIRESVNRAYQEGYNYHQEEVKKDSNLLEWVLRENYRGENAKLPALR